MSKMSELCIDIELMLEQGHTPSRISEILEVPITWVYESAEMMEEKGNTEVFSPFETVNS